MPITEGRGLEPALGMVYSRRGAFYARGVRYANLDIARPVVGFVLVESADHNKIDSPRIYELPLSTFLEWADEMSRI